MRNIAFAAGSLALLASLSAPAAEPDPLPATPKASIQFGAQTQRAFDRSGQYVTGEMRPDGSSATNLNGSFQNVTVARRGPNGRVETYCTTDEEDARSWMAREDDARYRDTYVTPDPGDEP